MNIKKQMAIKDSSGRTLMKGKFGLQSAAAPTKPLKPTTKTKGKK